MNNRSELQSIRASELQRCGTFRPKPHPQEPNLRSSAALKLFISVALKLCASVALSLTACSTDPTKGYSGTSIYASSISTVAVPIFTSDSFTRDVEFDLTDALIKEIESRTPYKVTSPSTADTIVLGHIRSIELDQLSKSRLTGLSEEVIVGLAVDFQWKDQRNGSILVQRRDFTAHGLFVPSTPSSEPIELGRFAAIKQLAQDIVAQMQAQW